MSEQIFTPRQSFEVRKRLAARWSVLTSTFFVVVKLFVWLKSGSVSVLAETFHSGADLIGSSLAMLSIQLADTPPDESHSYGHGKYENLSGMFIAVMVLAAAALTITEALQHLSERTPITNAGPALIVMGMSAIANALVSRHLLKVGKETNSPALTADGHHLRTDIVTSVGVFCGLLLVSLTHAEWIDPIAALIVAVFICYVGLRIARDSLVTLSDAALPAIEADILKAVLQDDQRVLGYHRLRTRMAGSHRHIDVHVQIADSTTFVDAHQITEELEESLRNALPNTHPIIHIEPYEEETAHQKAKHDGQRDTSEYRRADL